MGFRRWIVAVAAVAALGALAPASALAASSESNPPSGANDWSCRPSAAHPDPVVLVHGLGATMQENWNYMSPLLVARGYCVFALTYGIDPRWPYNGGVIAIEKSAPELDAFVNKVLGATGAAQVDLVGHSEGTYMPQYWLKFIAGAAAKVHRYVAMTPLYGGTNLAEAALLSDTFAPYGGSQALLGLIAQGCGSCPEFITGSDMQKKLVAGGAAVPGIIYTTIPTHYDELVSPWQSGLLPPGPGITNEPVQDVCANDVDEHLGEAVDPVVAQLIFNALDPTRNKAVDCTGAPPVAPSPSG